jgi:hypothetical protein
MAAAEGLPCATEVHTLHVAADGALWANTCAQVSVSTASASSPSPG